jgi:hypothetical protein
VVDAAGLTLTAGAPPTPVPVTLPGLINAPATLTFTPNADVDLGSGAGAAHSVTINPGDPTSFDLAARAVADNLLEGPEFAVASVPVSSAEPDWDGLPVAPLLFEILDVRPAPADLLLGDAPRRVSSRDPDAWTDAWSDDGATLEWTQESAAPVWSPINISDQNPETYGGGQYRGDIGVSGRTPHAELWAQEIDGSEAFRVLLTDMRASRLTAELSNFDRRHGGPGADESARFRFFDDDGALLAEEIVSAADGPEFTFDGFFGAAEVVIDAGAEIGGAFVGGALANGAPPTAQIGGGFLIDSLFFEGEVLI